ncbi:hypothetical protein C4585_02450 [Candidatus Parcubacteria bacterium]|nr:MAG: hypothetical protein C4585_02450 [Candidatus Parcubacteria bacterium]
MSRGLLFTQPIILLILAAIHLASIEYDLYWQFLWLDLISHTLGGMWAGLCVLWVRSLLGYPPTLFWGFLGAFIIGIGWEILEVVAGLPREANYTLDTSLDILMDVLGGVVAVFIGQLFVKKSTSLSKE